MCKWNKNQVSPYDHTNIEIHSISRPEDDLISNCGKYFRKTVSFLDIVLFIDEQNIVTYVELDCGITFYPETLQKSDRSPENRISFPEPLKNPSAFPVTTNITVWLLNTIARKTVWTPTIYRFKFKQL